MTLHTRWDDPDLKVASDTTWRACYRALQSWYRETELRVSPGRDAGGRLVGSLLPESEVAARPGLNFLTGEIAEYVEGRVPEVLRAGGTINVNRLRRNMLSSMPLCFNLFGYLRGVPSVVADVFSCLLNLDIARIERIEVEWAPPSREHLQDRTAFDTLLQYHSRDGRMGFLAVETKYTEPFSRKVYEGARYRELTERSDSGFRLGAYERLLGARTNQLWRNILLTQSLKRAWNASGQCVVVACQDDAGAQAALSGLCVELREPDEVLRFLPLEKLLAAFAAHPETANWAERFRQRYLILPPGFKQERGTP